MPFVPKSVPMAECLNFGLGLADNEELRQAIMQPGPMFHDVIFKYMDFGQVNGLPSQNEKKEVVLSVTPKNIDVSPLNYANDMSNSFNELEDKLAECSFDDFDSSDENKIDQNYMKKPGVPCVDSALYFLPVNYNKRNPWRRTIGLHVYGHELRSATYPARSSVKKLRFAQAKKPLNYLYSYFSVEILDCDDSSSITIGICRKVRLGGTVKHLTARASLQKPYAEQIMTLRQLYGWANHNVVGVISKFVTTEEYEKDYPNKVSPGKNSGSVGYNSDTGAVSIRDVIFLDGPRYSKGDVIGCGIIYPSHYKRYAELSTDDNSDGMSDVVLSSLVNTNSKSVDFVCSVLNLNNSQNEPVEEMETAHNHADIKRNAEESYNDYYNENFVESRTQVEIYFTHNMKVVGKVLSHVPVGGFYPTIHMFSCSAIKINVDLNPPFS